MNDSTNSEHVNQAGQAVLAPACRAYGPPGSISNPYLAIRYAITYQVAVTQEENDSLPEQAPWKEILDTWENSQAGPPRIVSGSLLCNTEWSASFEDPDDARDYEPADYEIDDEDARAAADALRVYPNSNDGEPTVDTCYLVDDLDDVIRRLELIRGGAWTVPSLHVSIGPDDLAALGRRLQALTRALAKARFEKPAGKG